MRRYDIDWLRVIAIGLLLIYHIAIVFQPWAVMIGFIQSPDTMPNLWIPMAALNVWRIPFLFFVSGMGVSFAMRKRNWKQLLAERTLRIQVPYIVGILAIVPLHIFVFQKYNEISFSYIPNPGHLWFLGNIFVYVLVLSPFFYWMKKYPTGKVQRVLSKIYSNPFCLLLIALPILAEVLILNPGSYEFYAMTNHGFWLGLITFFFGFTFIYAGETFWKTVKKWKWAYLGLGFGLYLVRLLVFELKAPMYMQPLETVAWVMAVFGIGHTYLNRPGKVLSYLSEGAYPIYIVHMFWIYLGAYLIIPIGGPVIWQLSTLTVFTFAGSILTYESIRHIKPIRVLFGLKWNKKAPQKVENNEAEAQVAMG